MSEINYARAQARYLAAKFPNRGIDPEQVVRVRAVYDEGYNYSSYTFEDPSFDIVVEMADGRTHKYYCDNETIDLTEMVIEGIRLEEEALRA